MDKKNPFIIEMNEESSFENFINDEENEISFEFSKNHPWQESFLEKSQDEDVFEKLFIELTAIKKNIEDINAILSTVFKLPN